jgi:hypothetical protein
MKVYKMGPKGCAQHIEKDPQILFECWVNEHAEVGDVYEVTIMEITEEEWKALPEYMGP